MSTASFANWAGNITEIGPIYPFVGLEGLVYVLCLALWIIWHVVQIRRENRHYRDDVARFGRKDQLRRIVNSEDPANP